jgi:hypothetical protein
MRTISLVLVVALASITDTVAQTASRPTASLLVGPSPYDLSGTGTGFTIGAWIDYPVFSFLRIEGGSAYFQYTTPYGTGYRYLLPEVGFRLGAPIGPLLPYLGGGGGIAFTVSGRDDTSWTLHAVLGLRARLAGRIGVRAEFRLRSVDPFHGNMGDVVGGVVVRL